MPGGKHTTAKAIYQTNQTDCDEIYMEGGIVYIICPTETIVVHPNGLGVLATKPAAPKLQTQAVKPAPFQKKLQPKIGTDRTIREGEPLPRRTKR